MRFNLPLTGLSALPSLLQLLSWEDLMKVSFEGNEAVIRIPLDESPKVSESGKNLVIASTHGFVVTEAQHKGKSVKANINLCISTK